VMMMMTTSIHSSFSWVMRLCTLVISDLRPTGVCCTVYVVFFACCFYKKDMIRSRDSNNQFGGGQVGPPKSYLDTVLYSTVLTVEGEKEREEKYCEYTFFFT
jgi:hypothetical protein